MDEARVFAFLADKQAQGHACALVTVLSVEGSSMRNPGTHMGVCEDGSFSGSLSGGCIENAVVGEALAALGEGAPREVRFGAGSPYLDIKLPCGGALDIHCQPLAGTAVVNSVLAAIERRKPYTIAVEVDGIRVIDGWQPSDRQFGHWPQLRLEIVGHGAGVEAVARLARAMQVESHVLTPDVRMLESLREQAIRATRIDRTSDTHLLVGDPWTAFVFLFHDHDWEVQLMARALDLPHFYLGAMGSRKAHATRCSALEAAGVRPEAIASINAPIGLFHSSRDPETLALSALGEIVRAYQQADSEVVLG
ncbi:XdhC family protein [Parerythrobacter aestuarii]|uniref:XdhC family protein n=1 Tax=Parerythrobacter aestuarii TaxID=3020909 RepID=UPI0024DE8DB7|nr:XdhC family protein [Parerythrobacter aestuarii]